MLNRTKVRNEIKSRLENATAAEDRININPINFDNPYPLIEVSTPIENATVASSSYPLSDTTLNVAIDVVDETVEDDIFNKLDELAEEIRSILYTDETLGGIVNSIRLVQTETDKSEEGERTTGFMRLNYEASYFE